MRTSVKHVLVLDILHEKVTLTSPARARLKDALASLAEMTDEQLGEYHQAWILFHGFLKHVPPEICRPRNSPTSWMNPILTPGVDL